MVSNVTVALDTFAAPPFSLHLASKLKHESVSRCARLSCCLTLPPDVNVRNRWMATAGGTSLLHPKNSTTPFKRQSRRRNDWPDLRISISSVFTGSKIPRLPYTALIHTDIMLEKL